MKSYFTVLLLANIVQAADVQVVVPSHLGGAVGGNSALWPFTFEELRIESRRYQQVYDASQFGAIASQGGYIKQLWFREGGSNPGDTSEFLPSVQINLGVTSRAPDALSPLFAENIDGIYTVVYASSLQIETQIGWTIITLAQPFFYSPEAGNLLLDIRTFASGGPTNSIDDLPALDAEDTLGDPVSSVFASDVNATSGFISTLGLVTQFRIEPIPEPSTWVLLGLGLLGMWRFLRRK